MYVCNPQKIKQAHCRRKKLFTILALASTKQLFVYCELFMGISQLFYIAVVDSNFRSFFRIKTKSLSILIT